jgi:hypothetical protein
MRYQRAVGFPTWDRPTVHGDDQQPTVGQPTDPTRAVVQLGLDAEVAVQPDRRNVMLQEVREPQSVVPPPQSLAEAEAVHHQGELA